jgi:hypothetical protein
MATARSARMTRGGLAPAGSAEVAWLTHETNLAVRLPAGAPFTARSERNIKFRVSREAAHETSAWHCRGGRLARPGDRCICSIHADACHRCSGAIQPFSRRARTHGKTICLSNRFAGIERTGATRSGATLRRTGASRLPETGNRSEDRGSTAEGLCKELRAIGSIGHWRKKTQQQAGISAWPAYFFVRAGAVALGVVVTDIDTLP